jgi:NTP pyrophosphatase (non-canonical NTP hydrolase)
MKIQDPRNSAKNIYDFSPDLRDTVIKFIRAGKEEIFMIEHPNEYQKLTGSTAIYPREKALEYLTLGLVGEAGEIANKAKKIIRDGTGEEALKEIQAELGDVLWYISELCSLTDIRLSTVMENNIRKLQSRKERGTLKGSGDTR